MDPRHSLRDPSLLLSPSLLIYRDLVQRNIEGMIAIARGADRLRPHAKTHKMAEIIRMEGGLGIHKHKVATIAEAEMAAAAGGTDVLLAYPLVGPNLARFGRLVQAYPSHDVPCAVVDHPDSRVPCPSPQGTSIGPFRCWLTSRSGWEEPGSIPAILPPRFTV